MTTTTALDVLVSPPDADFTVVHDYALGYARLDPLPDEATVDAYYSSDTFYSEHSPPDWFQHERSQWYYDKHVFADWLDTLAEHSEWPAPGEILDIGCGSGGLLSVAQDKGWLCTGIEPSAQARKIAQERGLNGVFAPWPVSMIPADINDDSTMADNAYDAVTMILLLEHLVNPLAMLQKAYQFIRPNGLLFVQVPHDFTWIQDLVRQKYSLPAWFVCRPHINYFTPDTIQTLIERAGFTVEDVFTTFPIEQAALMGDNYIGNEDLGRACYRRKMEFEMSFYQHNKTKELRALQHSYLMAGIGREIVVVARKE